MKKSIILLISLSFLTLPLFSQIEIPNAVNHAQQYDGYAQSDGTPIEAPQYKPLSDEAKAIMNEIEQLRKSQNYDGNRVLQLQSRLDALTGKTVTPQTTFYPGTVVIEQHQSPVFQTETIGNTRVYLSSGTSFIKAIATATETVGPTAGRIWAVFAVGGAPDTVKIRYSTNGGQSWISFAHIDLGGTDIVNYGDLDIEIIEPTIGDKYLHIVYGLKDNGGAGGWFTGGAAFRITGTFAGNIYAFSWPGHHADNKYYNIRLTSDNATWPSSAWIYIACSFDSLTSAPSHFNTQKFARIINPYTTPPVITYSADRVWWYLLNPVPRILYTDIAYFKNGGMDSVIISFSGVPDSTKIFFSKVAGSGILPASGYHFASGSDAVSFKDHAKLASNSNDNGSVFCFFNQLSGTNYGLKYFRTTNYGNFLDIAGQSILFGGSFGAGNPSIVGLRNTNSYRLALQILRTSNDSVLSVSVNSLGLFTQTSERMNGFNFATSYYAPEAGIRYESGDSCFMLVSQSGPLALWSAYGCSGAISGVGNISEPVKYSLSQNYPNPFNPFTKIYYSIASRGNVRLGVYDVLGREVALLVNEVKNAGNYVFELNGAKLTSGIYFYRIVSGNYSETKKMVLIK